MLVFKNFKNEMPKKNENIVIYLIDVNQKQNDKSQIFTTAVLCEGEIRVQDLKTLVWETIIDAELLAELVAGGNWDGYEVLWLYQGELRSVIELNAIIPVNNTAEPVDQNLVRYNYMWFLDTTTDKIFTVTFAYNNYCAAFAIQSLSNSHNKRVAKHIAFSRLLNGDSVRFGSEIDWKSVKQWFQTIANHNRYFYLNSGRKIEIPSHLSRAILINKLKRDKKHG